jgi:hypothetical protein
MQDSFYIYDDDSFYIYDDDTKVCDCVKYTTLREVLDKLRRRKKYLINKRIYSPKKKIYEDYRDGYFIIQNERFSFDFDNDLIIEEQSFTIMNTNDFLRKYNYLPEDYEKDKKDYEEELRYQITQLDKPQQLDNVIIIIGDYDNKKIIGHSKRQIFEIIFNDIVNNFEDNLDDLLKYFEISNSVDLFLSSSVDLFLLRCDFNDLFKSYKMKIIYENKEIIFNLKISINSENRPSFMFYDNSDDNYNEMSIKDFLTKFNIDEMEKYSIEDFLEEKTNFEIILEELKERVQRRRNNPTYYRNFW